MIIREPVPCDRLSGLHAKDCYESAPIKDLNDKPDDSNDKASYRKSTASLRWIFLCLTHS